MAKQTQNSKAFTTETRRSRGEDQHPQRRFTDRRHAILRTRLSAIDVMLQGLQDEAAIAELENIRQAIVKVLQSEYPVFIFAAWPSTRSFIKASHEGGFYDRC